MEYLYNCLRAGGGIIIGGNVYLQLIFCILTICVFRAIASATRVVFGRNSVAKDLASEMTERNHYMDKHFRKVDLDLKFKPAKKDSEDSDDNSEDEYDKAVKDENGCVDIKRVGVFTNELDEFVAHLMQLRVLDPNTAILKIGLDDGQGIFKVCLFLPDPHTWLGTK